MLTRISFFEARFRSWGIVLALVVVLDRGGCLHVTVTETSGPLRRRRNKIMTRGIEFPLRRGNQTSTIWTPTVFVENGDDRGRSEPQPLVVPHKSEFHPSTAEEVSRFEGMRKPETAPRNRDKSRRPVRPRTLQTRFRIVDHGKQVIRMFRDHSEQVSRTEAVQ